MASIRKKLTDRGEVRYEVRLRIDGRQVSKTFRRKRDADDWANRTEVDKSRDSPSTPPPVGSPLPNTSPTTSQPAPLLPPPRSPTGTCTPG